MTMKNPLEHSEADLLELAYPYALHAVTEVERRLIEERRAAADRVSAAEFDETVDQVRETLAALSVLDARTPPAGLEHRLMRALDCAVGPASARRNRGRSRRNRFAAVLALLIALGAGVAAVTHRRSRLPGVTGAVQWEPGPSAARRAGRVARRAARDPGPERPAPPRSLPSPSAPSSRRRRPPRA
ncbi:RskA family anti-sigma factor [Nocardia sp. bgisy134]|uniref:RskA family anti-sigma factor n=1 Tax=Nocardia sp. bgisy134 TaxID=3413789 RepID=UPI003D757437